MMLAHRRTIAALVAAACLPGLPLLAADNSTAAGPSIIKVTTSRGGFDMMVYAPKSRLTDRPPGERAVEPARADPKPVVLLISGEGGWKSFDILLSGFLRDDGFWVGGVDAKAYFWDPQDDRGLLAADMRSYATALKGAAGQPTDAPVVLLGYSFGADLAPWVGGAPGWGARTRGMVLIGPDENGSLEFRFTEMLGFKYQDHAFSVAEALKSAAGIPTVYIHGEKDGWSKAPKLLAVTADPKKLIAIPDATHHFGGHLDELRAALRESMDFILKTAPAAPSPPRRGR